MNKTDDIRILFATRITRLFAYGLLSVVLMLYMAELGFSEARIGLLFTLTLLGDTLISLIITTTADRFGRRRMLLIGSALMVFAGVSFATADSFIFLVIAATVGVISPSGSEVGPFLSIEQASLSQLVSAGQRTWTFAWYNLVGSFATAAGALAGGVGAQRLQAGGMTPLASYRSIVIVYASIGAVLALMFAVLSRAIEAARVPLSANSTDRAAKLPLFRLHNMLGLNNSAPIVFKLSALFSIDAFAGGLVLQSVVAYWFHIHFGVQPAALGAIFFAGNAVAGISALTASWLSKRIGLINTMVFTHIPSSVFLMLIPLMPTVALAVTMLLLRFSISQMDVPTRQSYTMAIVHPDERSAAGGVTAVARSAGASISPALAGRLIGSSYYSVPFFLAGLLKITYDLLLYRSFRSLKG